MLALEGRSGPCIFCAFRTESLVPISPNRKHYVSTATRMFRKTTESRRSPPKQPQLKSRGRSSKPVYLDRTEYQGLPGLSQRKLESLPQPSRFRLGTRTRIEIKTRRVRIEHFDIEKVITERLELLAVKLKDSPLLESLGLSQRTFESSFKAFQHGIAGSFAESTSSSGESKELPVLEILRQAYVNKELEGLDAQLKHSFYAHVASSRFTGSDILNQAKLADLRYPVEWYPGTRTVQRTLHLHVGPTNSGKTYHALKRLEEAKTGLYAGPLRLLAHEVYTRLNAIGKPCSLITGDDRKVPEGMEDQMSSCTVEMVPLNAHLEVAVIDEIQMIGNLERGWAWTQALLGLRAKEIHLCGEERAVPLIRELAAAMGDKLEIHQYQRLSPLRAMTTSLKGDLRKLRKGDCLVVFSRMGIHALKSDIERCTGKRVAVVYGSLPPETRAQQARLFNDPDNDYDILVASDAIGMGLNLSVYPPKWVIAGSLLTSFCRSIKRIVFESTLKHDGTGLKTLKIPEIKQIAGRAGRFRTAAQAASDHDSHTSVGVAEGADNGAKRSASTNTNLGLVTSLEDSDLPIIQQAMKSEAPPILTAGIFPPTKILLQFAAYFPQGTSFGYILRRLHEITRLHPRFHLCSLHDQLEIADAIQPFERLTIADRAAFCAAPVTLRDRGLPPILHDYAKCVAEQTSGALLDIPSLDLEILEGEVTANKEYLRQLETLHKALVLYLWLSYRFDGVFTDRLLASYVKELVEERIDKVLAHYAKSKEMRQTMKKAREQTLIQGLKRQLAAKVPTQEIGESEKALPVRWAELPHALSVDNSSLPDADRIATAV